MKRANFKSIMGLTVLLSFVSVPSFAGPKAAQEGPKEVNASGRIANETMDAIADVLTGKESKAETTKSLPPGLAKKGKTPPGWDKGRKTGWKTEAKKEEESPIKKFVKSVFSQAPQKNASQ